MTCSKCQSLMVRELSVPHHTTDYSLDLNDVRTVRGGSYRCVCCGNFEDAVILANRAKQADERRLVAEAESLAMAHSVTCATQTEAA